MSANTSPMPQWIDDSHIDPAWFVAQTNIPCENIIAEDISTNQGRVGSAPRYGGTLFLTCENGTEQPTYFILKQTCGNQSLQLARHLGLAREALFLRDLRPATSTLPNVFYAYGNMETGEKCIVMEALSHKEWIEAGYLFGPTDNFRSNPHNWTRSMATRLSQAFGNQSIPTPASVTRKCFVAVAQIHARYWCNESLLEYPYLRGQAWHRGHDRDSWEASQSLVRNIWQKAQSRTNIIQWDDRVKAAVHKCISGISWENRRNHRYWTLVHGDFWPGNIMWNTHAGQDKSDVKLIDWEMVGIGSGPQDLGQFAISNMDPLDRRKNEQSLVRAYCDELIRSGVNVDDKDLWEFCWTEYQVGGAERWLWFLVWFLGQEKETLLDWAVFFHSQIASFMQDHDLTAASLRQVRP